MANLTNNKDIDYIIRDFNSISDAIINFSTVNYGPGTTKNRLWTNFNSDSFGRNFLEIVAYVSDQLHFYLDQQSTQNFLQTATVRSSVLDIAAQFGFVPASATSASGDVSFVFTAGGTVPRGFKLTSSGGVTFFLTQDLIAGSAGTYTGTALQGSISSQTFTATGLQNEEFLLAGPNVIVDLDNTNPNDISPSVSVFSNTYTLVDGFLRFDGSDSPSVTDSLGDIIGGGRVFTLNQKADGTPFLRFGDGIFGRKLISGETITVNYRTGGGTLGNIAEQTITNSDSLPFISSVTNPAKFSGGADEQSIEQLRQLIPASLRTLDRAVAESDYSDLITTTFTEIFAASTEANVSDPGIDLNIYVVPQGSGITKITDNSLLLTQINSYVDRRKMVTVQFQILDAFGVATVIALEVFIKNTSSKTTVRNSIQTALSNFFNLSTGNVDGSGIGFAQQILLKDIYSTIEIIDGIDRFEIKELSYKPRISDEVQGLTTTYNHSDVTIFPNVTESEWILVAEKVITEISGTVIFSNPSAEGFSYNSTTGKITYNFPVNLSGVGPGDLFRNGIGRKEKIEIQTVGDGTGAYEIFEVTTVADQQGTKEVTTITTVADVAGSLGGSYFMIYDAAGSVAVWFNVASGNTQPSTGANRHLEVAISSGATANAVALATKLVLDGDSEFSVPVPGANIITVTHETKLSVSDAADGSVPTGFTFTIAIQGISPDSLSETYFDTSDDVGPVRVWFNVSGGSIAPAIPGGGRLLPVAITANDPANTVATALKNAIDADSKFSATVIADKVTTTNSFVGTRTDIVDGIIATGFTLNTITQGSPAVSIDGKYFSITTATESVAYWIDVNGDSSPAIPSAITLGVNRVHVITSTTPGGSANTIAGQITTALNADSATISATSSLNTITVEDDSIGLRNDAQAGTSGFTITNIIQGVYNDTDFQIFSVDASDSSLYILPNQPVNPIAAINGGGSIRNGSTSYQSYLCYKKINAIATNLASDSITDSSMDLSIKIGNAAALNSRTLIDNSQVFVPAEYATGNYYLVDGAGNIWEIEDNSSNTLLTSITAVNDAGITSVTAGDYRIVTKLISSQVVFNGSIFNIQYNSHNTITSIGAQFTQIGTIGDVFQISEIQTNKGNLGVVADLISFDQSTGLVRLNESPDLLGINSGNLLLDSSGQSFSIVSVDNRALPQISYTDQNTDLVIKGTGIGTQYSQGFQVSTTDNYSVVSFSLRKSGNATGNITTKIVGDSAGLPDITNVIAISRSVSISSLTETTDRVVFTFSIPPLLSIGIQYHVVVSGDTSYNSTQQDGISILANPSISYTYTSLSGLIQYSAPVSLGAVIPGHFFQDNSSNLFKIISVNDASDSINVTPASTVVAGSNSLVLAYDNVYLAVDDSTPTFPTGELSQFNGSVWSNSTLGPDQFVSSVDAAFSVEGPKSIKIESNLTPILGPGATITSRYYDDRNEISLALGISSGSIVAADDANPLGRGTVGAIPDSKVDHFIFRTSHYTDDIVNLRKMEIPELSLSDLELNILGGIA